MVERSRDVETGPAQSGAESRKETLEPIQVDPETSKLLVAFEARVAAGLVETVPHGRIREAFEKIKLDSRRRRENFA